MENERGSHYEECVMSGPKANHSSGKSTEDEDKENQMPNTSQYGQMELGAVKTENRQLKQKVEAHEKDNKAIKEENKVLKYKVETQAKALQDLKRGMRLVKNHRDVLLQGSPSGESEGDDKKDGGRGRCWRGRWRRALGGTSRARRRR